MITIALWIAGSIGGALIVTLSLAACDISAIALLNVVLARPAYLLYLRVRGPVRAEYYGMHRPGVPPDETPEWDELPEEASVDVS